MVARTALRLEKSEMNELEKSCCGHWDRLKRAVDLLGDLDSHCTQKPTEQVSGVLEAGFLALIGCTLHREKIGEAGVRDEQIETLKTVVYALQSAEMIRDRLYGVAQDQLEKLQEQVNRAFENNENDERKKFFFGGYTWRPGG